MSRKWLPAEVLPQSSTMLLLSRIVAWGPDSLSGEVDVTADTLFAEAGLGVPRWVGLEYMAQAVGALDGIRLREAGLPVSPGYLLGTRRLDGVEGHFVPGTMLRISVREILQGDNGLGKFACRLDDGDRSLSCELTVYRPPAPGGQSGE